MNPPVHEHHAYGIVRTVPARARGQKEVDCARRVGRLVTAPGIEVREDCRAGAGIGIGFWIERLQMTEIACVPAEAVGDAL